MSLAREPSVDWAWAPWRLTAGAALSALYWLAAALLSARAYDIGFHRYEPKASLFTAADNNLALVVARDAGLWSATTTAAAALVLFLLILALREAERRLAWRIGRRG
jgi:ACR3 family arsenite efflux pump ArsB